MRFFLGILLCATTLAVPVVVLAGGGPAGFDGVVNTLEDRYHSHAMRIPFLGLISLVSRKATHEGVSNLHVADFENFSGEVDGEELNRIVEEKLGPEWQRMIRETSRKHGGEQTLIYMRPEGNRMGLFILDKESNEMDVVQLSVDPRHLDEEVSHYSHPHGDGDMTD